ncbi:MAG: NAD(P)H-hydrate dehydratase [Bacteroidales bacterium]|nr:NAD(P)H-hydrate dehydratase [Bacteroidales bacterium]
MKKMFLQSVIPSLDRATIEGEPISSLNLMERAASTITQWIFGNDNILPANIIIMAGPGNNGGDGLVVGRQLTEAYGLSGITNVAIHSYTSNSSKRSADCQANIDIFDKKGIKYDINNLTPSFPADSLIIDALFGTGLSRPLGEPFDRLVGLINDSGCPVLSIDTPSGLGDESTFGDSAYSAIVRATYTISFQFPRLSHMLPELETYVGTPVVTDINLLQSAIDATETTYFYADLADFKAIIKPRSRFAHKGSFGRAMVVAGSFGMMGAAEMAVEACVKSGAGLVTAVVPRCGYEIMQIANREAMTIVSEADNTIVWNKDIYDNRISALGIGPGLGRNDETQTSVRCFIEAYGGKIPIVIDADALFHLAQLIKNENFALPQNCILTPHDAEFDRLTHSHQSRLERIRTAQVFAREHNTTVILKGANTAIALPDGRICFNTTGNAGMATGGSGDVLTGLLTGLLAQGYSTEEAAVLGVGLHGMAGDAAAKRYTQISMSATDILNCIGKAFDDILHKR